MKRDLAELLRVTGAESDYAMFHRRPPRLVTVTHDELQDIVVGIQLYPSQSFAIFPMLNGVPLKVI